MIEHFTQAGMKELAGDMGISFYPRYFSDENLTDLCNAAVNHKLQEWEAQEPVAKAVSLVTGGIGLQWVGDPLPAGTALYTSALPAQPASADGFDSLRATSEDKTIYAVIAAQAQPAQDVNAELVFGFNRDDLASVADGLEAGYESTVNTGEDSVESTTAYAARFIRTALANAKAVPVQGVPDGRIVECAKRLVEHADFKLGGCLSADSKSREIPSNAISHVKARHLAALRDALSAAPQQEQKGGE